MLTINWANLAEIDDDECDFCLTKRQATALLAFTEYFRWHTRWSELGGTTTTDLNEFANDIEARLLDMTCLQPTIFQQSPDDDCLLEQSIDGGETWTPAFNFGTCIAPMVRDVTQVVDSRANEILDALLDMYDGTAGSISENVIYDASGDDVFRDNALCAITQIIVDAMVNAEIDRRVLEREAWDNVGDLLQTIGVVALGFGQVWITLGAGIARAFIEVATTAWAAVDSVHLSNEDARDNVACAMYNAMKGATPTQSRFQTSLDATTFFILSPEWWITQAIRPMLGELEFYLSFLQVWGEIYPFAKAGLLDACSCPEDDWRVDWLDGFGEAPNTTPLPQTTYDGGNDYYFDIAPGGTGAFAEIEVDLLAEFLIKEIRWESYNLNSRSISGHRIRLYDDAHVQIAEYEKNVWCWSSGADDGCVITDTIAANYGAGINARYIQISGQSYQPGSPGHEARVTSWLVIGNGAKPVGW